MTTLYVDVTMTVLTSLQSGIQRVVRKIAGELPEAARESGVEVRLVIAARGRFHLLNAAGRDQLFHPPSSPSFDPVPGAARERVRNAAARFPALLELMLQVNFARRHRDAFRRFCGPAVGFAPGDRLLLLDAFWDGGVADAARRAARAGAAVAAVIYDLIPVTHARYMIPTTAVRFPRALRDVGRVADHLIGISRHCAEQVREFLGDRTRATVSHFYLGNDVAPPARAIGDDDRPQPGFAMIGTIEPRKGHAVVLDAFEKLWARGIDVRLTIVGRIGWADAELTDRLRGHEQLGCRLVLRHDADDAELAALTRAADAIIMASRIEGFGLPIVEALAADKPVIVSDIPVFREIAGDAALYFDPLDPDALVSAIERFRAEAGAWRARAAAFGWISWKRSARDLVAELKDVQGAPSDRLLDERAGDGGPVGALSK